MRSCLLLTALLCAVADGAAPKRPLNLVLILTDNHSPWTLGCYGNTEIRTPNIDRLASQGTLFERCYSSNAVCSPTRATLLTGLIPSQHGVHCYLRAGGAQVGPNAYSTIAEFHTLPEILAEAGYVCGLSGKWHLGDNLKPQEGFSSSCWITKPHGHTQEFYDQEVIEDGRIRKEPKYLTDLWTEHAVRFIEQNHGKPFFLYLAYNGPYGLGASLLNASRNRHAEYYAGKDLLSFPREQRHPWLFNNKEYLGNPLAMRRYAAEVSGVDDGVGEVLQTLTRLKLDENTLVVFTADQGLAGGQSGLWGMGDHTRPLSAFDGTMHVPLIVRHPGAIKPGERSKGLLSNYDIYPTLLDYLGLKERIPTSPKPPGRSFVPTLHGEPLDEVEAVFFEFENVRAVRTARFKYIERFKQSPNELYDLRDDPGERRNLIDSPEYLVARAELRQQLQRFFAAHADPQYDLWRGGRSKADILSEALKPAK